MSDEDRKPYRVHEKNGMWSVVDDDGQMVCACGAEANAEHYVVLLNQAHERGYRRGYRDAKRA